MAINAKKLVAECDEKTIAVVWESVMLSYICMFSIYFHMSHYLWPHFSGILGNHYNGNYDPIWDIDKELDLLNAEKGWQIVSSLEFTMVIIIVKDIAP